VFSNLPVRRHTDILILTLIGSTPYRLSASGGRVASRRSDGAPSLPVALSGGHEDPAPVTGKGD
jgi:hypothetical protein